MSGDPTWLVLLGLIFNTAGSVLLAVGSLGSEGFIAKIDSQDHPHQARIARIGFRALLNQTGLYLSVSIIGFVILAIVLHSGRIVVPLLIAPTIYYGWRLASFLTHRLHEWSGDLLAAGTKRFGRSCLGFLFISLPLILLHSITFAFMAGVEYGVSVPLFWFTEKVIEPRVLMLFRRIARSSSRERMMALRRDTFLGIIVLLFGFLYQLAGTALILLQ